ncbi:DUF6318 family protein [Pauljensenia sp. 27098_8_83]
MTVPPLFDHLDTEDEDQLRHDAAPRDAVFEAGSGPGVGDDNPPAGTHPRLQAWLHVEPFYWTMRVVYVCLAAGAVFAVYINGVAEGWWHAWGEKPSVAATAPAAQPTPAPSLSSEAAMSGGYQIGPDGILVRPAQFAADTYTKPELPDEAKENTERGAELAAEYVVETLSYAWNTGDTQPFADITEAGVKFHDSTIDSVNTVYRNGWVYGNTSSITGILSVEPITDSKWGAQPDSIGVIFKVATTNGTACMGQRIIVSDSPFDVRVVLFMTWKEGRWIATEGSISDYEEK